MPRTFNLPERIAGFAAGSAEKGELLPVLTIEGLTSLDGATLPWRLEELDGSVFSHIPDLPPPSQIDNLLVIIAPDLSATAYVNELQLTGQIRVNRPVQADEHIYVSDILEIPSIDLGVPIPSDHAFIVVRSFGWRRALFYDLRSLGPKVHERNYDLSAVLAAQTLSLLTEKFSARPSIVDVRQAIAHLGGLLNSRCEDETRYQELLEQYPWLLGGQHTRIERHTSLDDRNIPDFVGVRVRDGARDLFEIKQPFLKCFRKDGSFSAKFNAAYEQAGRYLTFVRNNKEYLRSEKGLIFENPTCFLLVGWELSDAQLCRFREHEANHLSLSVLTYEQVLRQAQAFLELVERAAEWKPQLPSSQS